MRPKSKHPPRQKSKDVWCPKYYSTWEVEYNKAMEDFKGFTDSQIQGTRRTHINALMQDNTVAMRARAQALVDTRAKPG